ncbi:hypothetical protein AAFF_G00361880 [Aldrovandia affinis]|uniref:Reverse transcriptase RNase H-like domain-containing protein n=1 Tax=Aldrovandia affinis TaxID=143900 RepID=A0AAD7SHU1_9TELE|nr:hypothetical protein AAFF_G00361880 [Aldrovandia affinis]
MSHVMRDGTERPVAFALRSLSPAEKNYAQIDKEALGLVWGVKRFNQYLYGREFILVTDHQPLVSIFNPQKAIPATVAARMQRWALFLGGHRYKIEFKRTLSHANTDVAPDTIWRCHIDQLRRSEVRIEEELLDTVVPPATAQVNLPTLENEVDGQPAPGTPLGVTTADSSPGATPPEEKRYPTCRRNPPDRLTL